MAPSASLALFTQNFNPIIQLADLLQQMCPLYWRISAFLSSLGSGGNTQHMIHNE